MSLFILCGIEDVSKSDQSSTATFFKVGQTCVASDKTALIGKQ